MTADLTAWLLARISEDEAAAQAATPGPWRVGDGTILADGGVPTIVCDIDQPEDAPHVVRHDPARVLAQCAAYKSIVELHKSWPVLVEGPPEFPTIDPADPSQVAFRVSRQIAWLTEQEYRERFGAEPPTAPMLRALATIWADHPTYDAEWRLT